MGIMSRIVEEHREYPARKMESRYRQELEALAATVPGPFPVQAEGMRDLFDQAMADPAEAENPCRSTL